MSTETLEMLRNPSADRKDLLFKTIITQNSEESLLNAYQVKGQILKTTPKPDPHYKIGSNDPLIVVPEGKYNHRPGARLPSITLTRQQMKEQAEKTNTIPKKTTIRPVFKRLSSIETFPLAYQRHFYANTHKSSDYFDGDIMDSNKTVMKLLTGSSRSELTIPGRAADFTSEVTWRMQLRGDMS